MLRVRFHAREYFLKEKKPDLEPIRYSDKKGIRAPLSISEKAYYDEESSSVSRILIFISIL
jgi:hypothetical protein